MVATNRILQQLCIIYIYIILLFILLLHGYNFALAGLLHIVIHNKFPFLQGQIKYYVMLCVMLC